jgi:Asp-tRNA(Asn)/Glu-tRNA(Gln) amidotransferase B subunit
MGEIKSYLNQNAIHIDNFVLQPHHIVSIIELVDNGTVSSSGAKKLFDAYD